MSCATSSRPARPARPAISAGSATAPGYHWRSSDGSSGPRRTGDRRAREELVEACLPLIAGVARVYRGSQRITRVELLQEGVVGLLRALEGYDPDRGVPFWAYALWWVRQAMQQLIAELTRPMVLSDRTLRQLAQLKRAHHEYVRHHGHEPTGAQLASDTGMSREQVSDLLALERVPQSLDQPVSKGEGELGTFGELLVDPLAGDAYEQLLDHSEIEQVRALMGSLNDGSGQSCAAATVSTVPSNPCARSAIASASAANGGARSNSEPSANFAQPPVHSRHRDRRAVLSSHGAHRAQTWSTGNGRNENTDRRATSGASLGS